MRTITDHVTPGTLNEELVIGVIDRPSAQGGNHEYSIAHTPKPESVLVLSNLKFQNGAIKDVGINGITNEALIAIVIDRLRGFNGENPKPEGWGRTIGVASEVVAAMGREEEWGRFRCRENSAAITKLEEAMHWLAHRTQRRLARGVEGTMKP